MTIINKNIHSKVYFFGLCLMVIGLPLSVFLMSISQFILAINWFWEGSIKQKFYQFFKNKPAMIFSSIYIFHILGLLYTTDFAYAFNDLRVKLPFLVLPIILSTSDTLPNKKFRQLMLIFVLSVIIGTFASTYVLLTESIVDIRDVSLFISHIRFSLLICLAIFIIVYFLFKQDYCQRNQKIIFSVIICWLIIFLLVLESITGIGILIITFIILIIYYIIKAKNIYLKLGGMILFIMISTIASIYINNVIKDVTKMNTIDFSKLEKYSSKGNTYYHDTTNNTCENGNYVWVYVAMDEMKEAWNKRSSYSFDGKDKKNQDIKFTLIRFLSSKGFRKDADGVNLLSDNEIKSIEKGIANVNYQKKSDFVARIHQIIWEYENYKKTGNPGGHSVMQRFEYIKTSIALIKENFWIGVGTGDMDISFKDQYNKMNSPLDKEWRLRSHNQFLAIFVGFGVFGFSWFLFALFYPFLFMRKKLDYFYYIFFIIIFLSMLTEDTIETQAGVSFFVFFSSLFLFVKKNDKNICN